MAKTFDPKSYELAEHFLPDDATEEQKRELASRVQDAAEDYLTELESGRRPGVSLVPPPKYRNNWTRSRLSAARSGRDCDA